MASGKSGFRNTKLGKNVHRQIKRRGPPKPVATRHQGTRPPRGK